MAVYQERIPQVKQQLPKRRSNRKLLFLLVLFFLSVLIVIFIRSPYSKVREVQVYGNDIYTKEQIAKSSGIVPGMQFLNVWEKHVGQNLKPMEGISDVTVTRVFPGVIELHVSEYKRVAFWTSPDGNRYPLLENGTVLKQIDFSDRVVDRPLIRSWASPELLPQLGKALETLSSAVLSEISDISLTPTAYDKQRVTLYMRDGNEVHSVIYQLAKKLVWYPSIVKELPHGDKGILYLLESTWFSKYGTPIETDPAKAEGELEKQS